MYKTKDKSENKLRRIKLKYYIRALIKRFPQILSMLCLSSVLLVASFFMFPALFSCSPCFSYFIQKFSLPLVYEYDGRIEIVDSDGNHINQTVIVYIGGYSTEVNTEEDFKFKFTSETTRYLYATVEYSDQYNRKLTYTTKLFTNDKNKLKRNIRIDV